MKYLLLPLLDSLFFPPPLVPYFLFTARECNNYHKNNKNKHAVYVLELAPNTCGSTSAVLAIE